MEWNKHKGRNHRIRDMRKAGHTIGDIVKAMGASKSVISYHIKNIVPDLQELKRNRSKNAKEVLLMAPTSIP